MPQDISQLFTHSVGKYRLPFPVGINGHLTLHGSVGQPVKSGSRLSLLTGLFMEKIGLRTYHTFLTNMVDSRGISQRILLNLMRICIWEEGFTL